MKRYQKPQPELWTGRTSTNQLYLHEKVQFLDLEQHNIEATLSGIGLLGYACDEGVKRNQGRVGAKRGSAAFRTVFSKFPNHLNNTIAFYDVGTVHCSDHNLEAVQNELTQRIQQLLTLKLFPIVIGGGHDIAYGHYQGIKKVVGRETVGIINFDAHFDLRKNDTGNNSGTPFYQIAQDATAKNESFNYLCLGIRKDANDVSLFETAQNHNVVVIENNVFSIHYLEHIKRELDCFIATVDHVYVTIDLDGFSSAYAPGVSAPSPVGFLPDIVFECLKHILESKKLISLDIAEFNPIYDIDNQTAKLASSLAHYVMHNINIRLS